MLKMVRLMIKPVRYSSKLKRFPIKTVRYLSKRISSALELISFYYFDESLTKNI